MRLIVTVSSLLLVLLSGTSAAQQGHPLAGIWLGAWTPADGSRQNLVLELYWHDTTLSGNINPGFPDAATITRGELNSTDWTVRLEAESKNAAGETVQVVVEGQIENLGSPNRNLVGTWQRGGNTGIFQLQRE